MLELIDTTGMFVSKGLKLLSDEAFGATKDYYQRIIVIYSLMFYIVVVATVVFFLVFSCYGYQ